MIFCDICNSTQGHGFPAIWRPPIYRFSRPSLLSKSEEIVSSLRVDSSDAVGLLCRMELVVNERSNVAEGNHAQSARSDCCDQPKHQLQRREQRSSPGPN
ncbi:uncharacterized protein UTRI_04100 [Ustilago trichophora]|uniref:Uncharacterized protein n=1 Tax=Ustilago trichophora TaxID=86804 RepID=A0A5C3EA77_9BASI|nr:uncharacterized protein UTRI_04100 [Ustilago trichophora]